MPLNVAPGPEAQSVASQTSDPGMVSLIPAKSHTFDEIISMVILLQRVVNV